MASTAVKVQVKQGVIVGKQQVLPNGDPFSIFQGIPYAVPPVGKLRFRSPVPLERFNVPELDCTKEGDICHQRDPFTQELVGSENCLFLNVYAPHANEQGPLPVMMWIHGGGFWFGSGNEFFPKAFMEEQVIVVTINYRLGALGFLSLPEEGIWGNAGLKDQRLALQWIQQNIAAFNGDPHNVTIFGESAGAASVHLHAYARHSKKLFHKAIMQSGTANMEWVFQPNPAYKTHRLAELLGCQSNATRDMLTTLQSASLKNIFGFTVSVLTPDERRRGLPFAFKPIIEDAGSPDSFIEKPILEMLQRPNTLSIPTIMGYNTAEGIAMVINAIKRLETVDQDLERFVPRNIPLATDDAAIKELAQKMRDFYLGGRRLTSEMLDALTDLLSDYHFVVDMQRAAELQVHHQANAPLYFYRLEYVGKRISYKRLLQMEQLKGVCHADELFHLFQSAEEEESSIHPEDALITKRFCRLWANFARYGHPTPKGLEPPVVDCAWLPVQQPKSAKDQFTLDYLAIDRHCHMQRNPDHKRIEFWRNIYRKYIPTDYSLLSAKL